MTPALLESFAIKTALGWAKDWLFDAASWIAKHPWQSACALLAAWLAWIYVFTLPGLEADIDREALSHAQTKEDYRQAQAQAKAQWEAATAQWEQDRKDAAHEADEREFKARSDALDAAERFIARSRLQCPTRGAVGSATSAAAGATESGGPESAERSDPLPELVGVPADDVRICTENTTRLKAAQDWSATLNER
ncbi:MAG: hypothetical protein AAF650_01445 [Pseudomonadota bacterium]